MRPEVKAAIERLREDCGEPLRYDAHGFIYLSEVRTNDVALVLHALKQLGEHLEQQTRDHAGSGLPAVVWDTETCAGASRMRGHRLPVHMILRDLAAEGSIAAYAKEFDLSEDEVKSVLLVVADAVERGDEARINLTLTGPRYRISDGKSLAEEGTLHELIPLLGGQTRCTMQQLLRIHAMGPDGLVDVETDSSTWIRVERLEEK